MCVFFLGLLYLEQWDSGHITHPSTCTYTTGIPGNVGCYALYVQVMFTMATVANVWVLDIVTEDVKARATGLRKNLNFESSHVLR